MQTSTAQLFTDARTHNAWQDRPVTEAQLRQIYELMKWGPTAANTCPLRIRFLASSEAKARLIPLMNPNNQAKTSAAPAVAVLGMDLEFFEQLPTLYPQVDARSWFVGKPAAAIERDALLNASLQAGYFIMAARSIGLDCGPMGGFDAAAVDAEFWAGTPVRSIVVVNLGYGDAAGLRPRNPRLDFDAACALL
ncbi:MAG: malonic semialdehyde reductase [Leptothrix sp. (in: b-proteobacteria)]